MSIISGHSTQATETESKTTLGLVPTKELRRDPKLGHQVEFGA